MFYFIKKLFKKQFARKYFLKKILPKNRPYQSAPAHNKTLKNILSINTSIGEGGVSKIVYDYLSKGLSQKGINTFHLVDKVIKINKPDNVIIFDKISSKDQRILYKAMFELAWIDFFHLSTFTIKDLPEFKQADILHLHNLHGNYFNLFALPELTALKPTIWTLHDEYSFTGHCASFCDCENWKFGCEVCPDIKRYFDITTDTSKFLLQTKNEIYNNSNFIIVCPSKWLKNQAKQSILKDKDIRLIYNGIDTDIFKPYDKYESREELGLPLNKKILMFSSNLGLNNVQKGTKYLFEAYKHFTNRNDVLFISLGGESKKYLYNNFISFPYITREKDMAKFYSAADLFIFPTLSESFGLVVAESLACQTPVITFETGPIPELVEHMKTGYVAKYKDSKDFIYGIELFLNNENLLIQTTKNSREKVIKNFSLKNMLDSYEKLYHESFNNYRMQER